MDDARQPQPMEQIDREEHPMTPSEDPAAVVENAAKSIRKLSKLHSSHVDIVTFASTIQNCVRALQSLNHIGHLQNPYIFQKMLLKLPSAIIYRHNDYCTGKIGKPSQTAIPNFFTVKLREPTTQARWA